MTTIRYRLVLLGLAVTALFFSALGATGYPAHAASSASAGRMSAAASGNTACDFVLSLKTCESAVPTASYTSNAFGDTSGCTFVFTIAWGDGSSTTKTETNPADGKHLEGRHTYLTERTYTLTVHAKTTVGACTATSSVHTFTLVPAATPNYSGYSFYRPGGYVKGITVDWTVPAVTCPAPGQPGNTGTPRVVIWAGLWGANSSMATDWLPQIGTDSQCYLGSAYYVGDFEMETAVAGGGGWSYVDGVPHTWGPGTRCFLNPSSVPNALYSYVSCGVANYSFAPFAVTAGDHVEAGVSYLGTDTSTSHKGDLIFRFTLRNKTRSQVESFNIETTKPVTEPQIITQGGGILEDHNDYGGLAKFGSASLKFASLSGTRSGPFGIDKWVMKVFGTQLAATGPIGSAPSYPFTVSFKCNGCLSGSPCPPRPPCTKY